MSGNFFDRINRSALSSQPKGSSTCLKAERLSTGTIIKIFLYSLYLPAGRQVLNIPPACLALRTLMAGRSIMSKKWDFYTIQLDKHQ
jgi:hypothetical protein